MKILKSFFDGNVFMFEYFRSQDARGDFAKPWIEGAFKDFSVREVFFSNSKKGVLRGMHYILKPSTQKRVVICLKGRIKDVVVDIRKGSPTYGKHISVELSENKNSAIFIGEEFAHGFLALDNSLILYLVDKPYDAKLDRGIIWNDPKLGIKWGIANPILSEKDAKHPMLEQAENNFIYGANK